jgi:hypothetical protein
MPVAAGLLLMTTLVVQGSPQTPSSTSDTPAAAPQPTPQGQNEAGTPTPSTTAPHQVGLGGFGGSGAGPSFRYFFNDRIGVDASAGWFGGPRTPSGSTSTAFQATSSVVLMLNGSHQMADLDFRPYVGGGFNYVNYGTPYQTSVSTQPATDGFGMQAFGGAELTFAAAKALAISAEVRYYKLPVEFVNASLRSGTDFYLLFHYYLH